SSDKNLMTMFAGTLALHYGINALFLGMNINEETVSETWRALSHNSILLGALELNDPGGNHLKHYLDNLLKKLPEDVELLVLSSSTLPDHGILGKNVHFFH